MAWNTKLQYEINAFVNSNTKRDCLPPELAIIDRSIKLGVEPSTLDICPM
jgi:hypothetical protein